MLIDQIEIPGVEIEEIPEKSRVYIKVTGIDHLGNEVDIDLLDKHKIFAELYVMHPESGGNGTQSYLAAYGLDPKQKRNVDRARVHASRLLRTKEGRKMQMYLTYLMLKSSLNLPNILRQLGWLIQQNGNLNVKFQAVKLGAAMHGVATSNHNHNHKHDHKVVKQIKVKQIEARKSDISD